MELDITHMVEDRDDMPMLSGSRAELGQDAGKITWRNSVAYGQKHPLLNSDEARDEARAYFKAFGAWSDEEIAAWSEQELQGITCQEIAAQIREMEHYDTYEEYQQACESGQASGSIYKSGDRWYFYLGH